MQPSEGARQPPGAQHLPHLVAARKPPAVNAAPCHHGRAEREVAEPHDVSGYVCGQSCVHTAVHTRAFWFMTQRVTLNLQQAYTAMEAQSGQAAATASSSRQPTATAKLTVLDKALCKWFIKVWVSQGDTLNPPGQCTARSLPAGPAAQRPQHHDPPCAAHEQ